jgi:hypothetical protein
MSVEVGVDTGTRAGLPHFLAALFGAAREGRVMAADGGVRRQSRRNHGLRDPRH